MIIVDRERHLQLLFSIILLFQQLPLLASWHDRKAEGWAWYEDKQAEVVEDEPAEPAKSPGEILDIEKKVLEEKLSTAILDPSEEHVLAYMEAQKKWIDQSAKFATTWSQILVNNPYLDYSVTGRPVSQYGLQWYKDQEIRKQEQFISKLRDRFGLFFFYEGGSDASKIVGQLVQGLAEKYQLKLIGISVDHQELPEFPSYKEDNGIAKALGVPIYPAIYLIDPKENIAVPIGFGLLAQDQMEKNIMIQLGDSHD